MNTKGVLKRVAFWGMLFAGGIGYAQSNHWKEHTQTTEVTDAGREALVARLVELQNYTLSILQKAQFNGDLQTALGAVEQARANVELMAAVGGRLPVPGTARPGGPATIYLIAFKDHVIRAATGYSVEGMTLYYTTPQGTREHAPLDSVDAAFSEQLNRERNVEFPLPPK
jgi:hypothetical protein